MFWKNTVPERSGNVASQTNHITLKWVILYGGGTRVKRGTSPPKMEPSECYPCLNSFDDGVFWDQTGNRSLSREECHKLSE